jgi:hypothetical protein
MKKDDPDLRKEIEDLEKLIDQVKKQNEEEKKRLRMNIKSQPRKVIRINLAVEYSDDLLINVIVGFLVNFMLIFALVSGLHLAEVANNYIYLLVAFGFTLFETVLKGILLRYFPHIVIYSQGLVFFLANLVFFYLMDLLVFPRSLTFVNNVYPILFVFIFQFVRVIIKNLYVFAVRKLSVRVMDKKK